VMRRLMAHPVPPEFRRASDCRWNGFQDPLAVAIG